VAAAVSVAVALAVGIGRASNALSSGSSHAGRPSGYHGPAYPGMLTNDKVAGSAGSSVTMSGETVTAGPLVRTPTLLGPTLCSQVTIADNGDVTKDVGPAEWKLQQPNGIVETFFITGTLQGGQVAPGGKVSGTVCFVDSGQAGRFVLVWQRLLDAHRAVWLLDL
jgi:hypothetical protein